MRRDHPDAQRWTTDAGARLSIKVFERLARGRTIADLDLGRHDKRIDLRGIAAPRPDVTGSRERSLAGRLFKVDRLRGVVEIRGATLEGVDFSGADLGKVLIHDSTFVSCRFDGANLRETGF